MIRCSHFFGLPCWVSNACLLRDTARASKNCCILMNIGESSVQRQPTGVGSGAENAREQQPDRREIDIETLGRATDSAG
jgi:hypothetical protein